MSLRLNRTVCSARAAGATFVLLLASEAPCDAARTSPVRVFTYLQPFSETKDDVTTSVTDYLHAPTRYDHG